MNPETTSPSNEPGLPPQQTSSGNPLEVMQAGEKELFNIKRHPFGLLAMFTFAALVLLALAMLLFVVLPSLSPGNKSQLTAIGFIIFLIMALIMIVFTFIANKVYWGNQWILSSDSLTQIKQTSLFNKQQSQLPLNKLEDVTAEKKGMLQQMFNYGTVTAETAGEHSKFSFPYCADPSARAQQVLAAREAMSQH
ncbi:MAG: PH domain-containing protein [Patescibacteria group bacterium]|nr:PH domain-containing protein [Patescibacteria group bacterium]